MDAQKQEKFTQERAQTLQLLLTQGIVFVDEVDDVDLTHKVEVLDDCYWITYTRADKPDWVEGHSIGTSYDEALEWVYSVVEGPEIIGW